MDNNENNENNENKDYQFFVETNKDTIETIFSRYKTKYEKSMKECTFPNTVINEIKQIKQDNEPILFLYSKDNIYIGITQYRFFIININTYSDISFSKLQYVVHEENSILYDDHLIFTFTDNSTISINIYYSIVCTIIKEMIMD